MAEPPFKCAASGYRWCPHCNLQVAESTYRTHRALFFPNESPGRRIEDSDKSEVLSTMYVLDCFLAHKLYYLTCRLTLLCLPRMTLR